MERKLARHSIASTQQPQTVFKDRLHDPERILAAYFFTGHPMLILSLWLNIAVLVPVTLSLILDADFA
jgi:hypothetical protein